MTATPNMTPGTIIMLNSASSSGKTSTLGQARLQHEIVHAHALYDFEVDMSLFSPRSCAEAIIAYIGSQPPQAFQHMKDSL